MKSKKMVWTVLILLGVVLLVGGFCFSILAEQNRGLGAAAGYTKDGEFVAVDQFTVGANKEKEENAQMVSTICYIVGGALICGGAVTLISVKRTELAKTVRQHGVIIEKILGPQEQVIVEFDDNSRKKLLVEPPVIVTEGDKGIIGYKKNLLVEFEKEL